jgi:hypothetical protein
MLVAADLDMAIYYMRSLGKTCSPLSRLSPLSEAACSVLGHFGVFPLPGKALSTARGTAL